MKNCKTFWKVQTASHLKENIQSPHIPPPHQIKPYCVSGTKIFFRRYREISRHLLSKCFKNAFLGVKKWCSANIFSDTKQKHVSWKICKVRKVFGCVAGAYYFQCQVN